MKTNRFIIQNEMRAEGKIARSTKKIVESVKNFSDLLPLSQIIIRHISNFITIR